MTGKDQTSLGVLGKHSKHTAVDREPPCCVGSVVTLEVKLWKDEIDMAALEKPVRSIEQEALVWNNSKLVAVGYGIKKLQITLVIEDELVSLDELQEKIAEFEATSGALT